MSSNFVLSLLYYFKSFILTCKFYFIIIFLINLFIFGCVGSSLLLKSFLQLAAGRGYSSLQRAGFSLRWLSCCRARALGVWASVVVAHGLQSAGLVVVAHRPSCSAACGILPDQGLNLCLLHWQVDSQPLHHQGSPLACKFQNQLVYFSRKAYWHYNRDCITYVDHLVRLDILAILSLPLHDRDISLC